MHTLRFGRKLSLPSTMAIKHQVMAQYEVKKAEAEARPEVFRGQPSLALPSVTPAGGSSKVNTDATKKDPPVGPTGLVVVFRAKETSTPAVRPFGIGPIVHDAPVL